MQVKELQLHCQPLEAQLQFYRDTLGLPIVQQKENSFEVQIGSSLLRFVKGSENSYYHFAINIASFQADAALNWLQDRLEVLPYQGNKMVDFSNWNALAMYFYDPARNIVEFIARRNLALQQEGDFSPQSLFHISEVGLPTQDVEGISKQLQNTLNMQPFDGDMQRFGAVGDEKGLFIIVDQEEKTWIPPSDQAKPFPFQLRATTAEGKDFEARYHKIKGNWQLDLRQP